jgi:hypothetical protein
VLFFQGSYNGESFPLGLMVFVDFVKKDGFWIDGMKCFVFGLVWCRVGILFKKFKKNGENLYIYRKVPLLCQSSL